MYALLALVVTLLAAVGWLSQVDTKCKDQCYPYVVAICDYNGVAVCASPEKVEPISLKEIE